MLYEGLSASQLGELIGSPYCVALSTVTSTLDVIHSLAEAGSPHGSVVIADEQVRGRGTQGREWHSPPGSGIWLGFLYRFTAPASGVLSLRVGLELVKSLGTLGIQASIKWPNDVMVADRKAAGILCEARTTGDSGWIGIGVGVNVYGPLDSALEAVAIPLDAVAEDINRVRILERFVPRLREMTDSNDLTADELEHFARHDWLCGKEIEAPTSGIAAGITPGGALRVVVDGENQLVFGGSVAVV